MGTITICQVPPPNGSGIEVTNPGPLPSSRGDIAARIRSPSFSSNDWAALRVIVIAVAARWVAHPQRHEVGLHRVNHGFDQAVGEPLNVVVDPLG